MTWDQWLHWASFQLKKSESPKRDAEIILGKVIQKSRTQLLAFGETKLKDDIVVHLQSLISRRIKGEPIAYIIGSKEFWSLNFKVTPGVFIPRPDTECLIKQALTLCMSKLDVLDLGVGVGTIALTLAFEKPEWNIIGVERQKRALCLAYKNKYLLRIKNTRFIYGNWFKYLTGKKFNLIVSNPPYIDPNDPCLQDSDITFEPKNALISKKSGLADLTIICRDAAQHLHKNGWIMLEHGWNQGQSVRTLLHKFGFHHIYTAYDFHHYERVTCGQWLYH